MRDSFDSFDSHNSLGLFPSLLPAIRVQSYNLSTYPPNNFEKIFY